MRRIATIPGLIVLAILIVAATNSQAGNRETAGKTAAAFSVSSPAFSSGKTIPARYSCGGKDFSPQLQWSNPPAGTNSFALIMDDPDAPIGTFVHWLVYNLPPDTRGLDEKASPAGALPRGSLEGKNGFGRIGYGGPCPPYGKPHRYFFRLYALDAMLDLPAGATRDRLVRAMQGHILGQAELVGLFAR